MALLFSPVCEWFDDWSVADCLATALFLTPEVQRFRAELD